MRRLLVTGAHGFIGSAVLARVNAFPELSAEGLSVRGDAWRAADFSRYDAVLHAAGIAHVDPTPETAHLYREINVERTLEVAAAAKAARVKQFIFLSSMIVFGRASRAGVRKTISADTPPTPVGAYGQSKLDAENGLRAMEDQNFKVAVVRPPMVYGPGCKGNYNALRTLARRLPMFPEFENQRSVLYIENLAELLRLIFVRGDAGVFHPQDAQQKSVSEIVRAVCAVHGKQMVFTRAFNPVLRLIGCGGAARRAFGDMVYAPEISLYPENYRIVDFDEAIRRTEGGYAWRA